MTSGVITSTLYFFIYILLILIYIRILLSWLRIPRENQIVSFLYTVTEPMLSPVRTLIDKSIFGGEGHVLDFSPLIVIMVLQALLSYVGNF